MDIIGQSIKATLPGSVPFFVVGVAAGVALLYWRADGGRLGRRFLTGLVTVYWLLCIPLGADALVAGLRGGFRSITAAREADGATAVVVLTAGTSTHRSGEHAVEVLNSAGAFRVLEAARVYRLLGNPWVIVAGGITDRHQARPEAACMRDELIRIGVPGDRILLDTVSRTTREHASHLPPLLRRHDIKRFVLVTSPTHMRRAVMTFDAAQLQFVPSVSALRSDDGSGWRWASLWPSSRALNISAAALYDYVGLTYYWSRGWFSTRQSSSLEDQRLERRALRSAGPIG